MPYMDAMGYYIGGYTHFGSLILSVDRGEGGFIWRQFTWWDVMRDSSNRHVGNKRSFIMPARKVVIREVWMVWEAEIPRN